MLKLIIVIHWNNGRFKFYTCVQKCASTTCSDLNVFILHSAVIPVYKIFKAAFYLISMIFIRHFKHRRVSPMSILCVPEIAQQLYCWQKGRLISYTSHPIPAFLSPIQSRRLMKWQWIFIKRFHSNGRSWLEVLGKCPFLKKW